MNYKLLNMATGLVLFGTLAGCGGSGGGSSNDGQSTIDRTIESLSINCATTTPAATNAGQTALSLSVAGTYISGNEFDTASAEIVTYDDCSDRLYVVNAEDQTVDVLSLASGNSAPSLAATIDLQAAATDAGLAIGAANSVVAKRGLVAVAIEAATKQDNGLVALYRSDDLSLLATYSAGALPDSITMDESAQYIVTANEGEPNGEYTNDPEGSVTIINIENGVGSDEAVLTQLDFKAFNTDGARAADMPADVRLPGPAGTTVAQDLEPEFVTIIDETGKAIVALQENNAIAIVDLASTSIDGFKGLGTKSWESAKLDTTNKDGTYSAMSYPQLVGYYMPDTIVSVAIDGANYILSANEGDGREYVYDASQQTCDNAGHDWDEDEDYAPGGDNEDATLYANEEGDCISFTDEGRGKDLNVDAAHPLMDEATLGTNLISNKNELGRIKVIMDKEDVAANENIHTFGARSFSIWDASGNLVWDSGDELSSRAYAADNTNFNTTNDNNESADDRSDDKGIEPEAIEVAKINGETFAFIGLERQGGVVVYNISNPNAPTFVQYINNRDFSQPVCTVVDDGDCDNDEYNSAALDLAPESIEYFTREGAHFIAVGNEVSGTTTVYSITMN